MSSVELPSGTVTLLFTDIEGSTRLLQQLRDRYGEVLTDHRRLLRAAFAAHGGSAWAADYAAPSGFINSLLACGSPENFSQICSRPLDAQVRRATALQVADPQAANALWARIDRRITDLAPMVPLASHSVLDFVSRRVGNFEYNPQWGMLFDQLWVR